MRTPGEWHRVVVGPAADPAHIAGTEGAGKIMHPDRCTASRTIGPMRHACIGMLYRKEFRTHIAKNT
jgi:hypothetical protein